MENGNDRQLLIRLAQAFNEYWQSGQLESLASLLDPEVVFTAPDFKDTVSGRDNCMKTFLRFTESTTVSVFHAHAPYVHIWGDLAVLTYGFMIHYTVNGTLYTEQGTDILIWKRKSDEDWRIIWRALANNIPLS